MINLNKEKSINICNKLNGYLANLNVEYVKLHNYHWNVTGQNFFQLHGKLEELYNGISKEVDEIAERILMLGGEPLASMKDYLNTSTLVEVMTGCKDSDNISKDVLNDFEVLLNQVREIVSLAQDNSDEYTVALLGNSIGNYEKNIWMLRAFLKNNCNL